MVSVDVIVATYNRAALLKRTLDSLRDIRRPAGVSLRVHVACNACTDATPATIAAFAASAPFPVIALDEPRAGKSFALNHALAHATAEWVAFFDDDERVAEDWLERMLAEQAVRHFDFVAGRYVADFEIEPPGWIPPRQGATVIARHDPEMPAQKITANDSIMWGGNCAIRRDALQRVGAFATDLGRASGLGALGCEDVDMQLRLVEAGFDGWYLPELRILHWIPRERLTKTFFRKKIFWAGYTSRRFERYRGLPDATPNVFGVARWRWRAAATAAVRMIGAALRFDEASRLDYELDLRHFAGYLAARREETAQRFNQIPLPQ